MARKAKPSEGARDRSLDPHTASVESHDEAEFKLAVHFLVVRRLGSKRWEVVFYDFDEALRAAAWLRSAGHQMLVYAITEHGGACLLPEARWPHFAEIWRSRHVTD